MKPGPHVIRRSTLVVGLLLLGALLLRAAGLELQSLWLDEFLAFSIGQASWSELLRLSRGIHGQSPLYYVLVKGWTALFGRDDVTVMRSLSVALGMVSLVQTYAFVRAFVGSTHAQVSLAVLAVSPFHLYFSQEARMYPLLIVEILAAAHLVLRLVRDPAAQTPARLAALALISVLALYTHYYAVLYLGALGLFALLYYRSTRRAFWGVAAAYGVAGLLYIPWIPALLAAAQGGGHSFTRFVELKFLYTAFTFALGYSSVVLDAAAKDDLIGTFLDHAPLLATGGVSFGWLLLVGARELWRKDRQIAVFAALVLVLPVLTATLVSISFPIISERYFTPGLPVFALVLATGILAERKWRRWAPLGVAALLVAHSLVNYYANPRFGHHDWRKAAAFVEQNIAPDEWIVFHPGFVAKCFRFYSESSHPAAHVKRPLQVDELPASRSYWLVSSHGDHLPEVVAAFERRFRRSRYEFLPRGEGISIYRFVPRGEVAGSRRAGGPG